MASKALTIHGPWAWAILQGIKRVENREWLTEYRGPLFIQAGQSLDSDDAARASFLKLGITEPKYIRGAIIGEVNLCAIYSLEEYLQKYGHDPYNREFARGPWCWVFENPRICEPVYCPGNFQLWPVKNPKEEFHFPAESVCPGVSLQEIYEKLLDHYGPQKWWPAESPLEVILGIILVRNSQWPVAERVIAGLKAKGLLQLDRLAELSEEQLQTEIRSTGRQKAKAKLILSLVNFWCEKWNGKLMAYLARPHEILRKELLAFSGIGRETTDLILLYAGNLPVCPVSIYTRRFMIRHQFVDEKADDEKMERLFYTHMGQDHAVFNEYYALLVKLGREYCAKTDTKCSTCPRGSMKPG
ncbi:hypothetical protein AGMMS50229_20910 [Campylobacterota bacterium]|nr:hypothetical protein AGMMS50229_20910 [Campylobacterota bacterium]